MHQAEEIRQLINTDIISMETALNLRDNQREALINDESIRQSVINETLDSAFVETLSI
jgi:hypothetical protein